MVDLVTVEQVNNALRLDLEDDVLDSSGDDADTSRLDDIVLKISQATDIVIDYLKLDPEYVEWTAETVPGRVSAAIIMVIDCLLDDSEQKAAWLAGLQGGSPDPRNPIAALLHRLRDPALA